MPYVYILHSEKVNRFYTGVTHDLDTRIESHLNNKYGTGHYTSITDDWTIFLSIEVDTIDHAIRLERKIISMKSSQYIKNLKKYKELQQKIIDLTS